MSQNDFTDRYRAVREQIAMKTSMRQRSDNQGRPIGEPVVWQYDTHGRLLHKHEPVVEDLVQPLEPEVEAGPTLPKPNPAQGSGGSGHLGGPEEAIAEATRSGNHSLAIALKQANAAHQRQLRNN